MEIPIQASIPSSPNQSECTDFESKLTISDQQPEISGAGDGDGLLKHPESPAQIGKLTPAGETPATPEFETPKKEKARSQNQSEKSNSEMKTATPVEKTEDETEKKRILVPKNGSMDRLKVPKSPNPAGKVKFSGIELPKNGTPNRLKVPKAFKYQER